MPNKETKNEAEKINLSELNECIEKNRRNMIRTTNYDFLEKLSRLILRKIKFEKNANITLGMLFSREEAISIVLKFFESLGNKQWYEQAKSIILGQNKDISISMFREKDISDFSEKNRDGLYKYSYGSEVEQSQYNHNKAIVRVSLNEEFLGNEYCVPSDKFTIKDIYSIAHEISHTFDLGENEDAVGKRQLFSEINSYCFEKMLTEYLINQNIISKKTREIIEQRGIKNNFRHARTVCAKVNLIKFKEKEESLTKENIKQILEKEGIKDPIYVQSMLKDVLISVPYIDYDARYPIAMFASHEYMKMYKKDKKQAIENLTKYCEAIKKGDTSVEVLKLVGCPVNIEEIEEVANDIIDTRCRE